MARLFLTPIGTVSSLNELCISIVYTLNKNQVQTMLCAPVSNHKAKSTEHFIKNQPELYTSGSLSINGVEKMLSEGKEDDILDKIVTDFLSKQNITESNSIVIEGMEDTCCGYASILNRQLAQTLSTKIILVCDASQVEPHELALKLAIERKLQKTDVSGYILTNFSHALTEKDYVQKLNRFLEEALCTLPCLGIISSTPASEIENVITHISASLEIEQITPLVQGISPIKQTPSVFRFNVIDKACRVNKRVVLPEGEEPRTITAAVKCHEKEIARCVLLGNPETIRAIAKEQGLRLPETIEIISPESIKEQYIAPMVELRKSKGLTPEQASEQLDDTVVLGTMMLAQGDVDGLVSGAVHTTASTVRPALQLIKTRPGESLVSSIFFMLMEDEIYVFGDCAINPNPTTQQLADIAIQSADSAKNFGIEPRVAMLSYSTGTSGTGESVDKVTEATKLVKEKRPDILVDGPLQYDAATVPSVGKQKAPDSQVAGRANVMIMPELNTGNITYKAVQRAANLISVGPMLQGLRKPVNDLSRGALVEDIVYTIALTAIQATQS